MNNDYRGRILDLAAEVDYADGAVVSKTLMDKTTGTLTVFAFDAGQGLSEHTSPYDATVMVLDGAARLTVGGKTITASSNQTVIMPAGVPHDVQAEERFKMLLIMIR